MKQKLHGLTILRFVAAFYVFLFHFHIRVPLLPQGYASNVLTNGAAGMTIFFVLSGFVLTYAYDGHLDVREYLISRFARIYPAYAFAVIASFIVLPISIHGWSGFLNIIANVFSVQGWFASLFPVGINGGTWSLSVEWFFYLLFPFILPLVARLNNIGMTLVMLAMWGVMFLVGYADFTMNDHNGSWIMLYSLPLARLPEFIFGICIAFVFKRTGDLKAAGLLLLADVVLLTYLLAQKPYTSAWVQLNWIVAPAIGFGIYLVAKMNADWSKVRPLIWLGEISYSFFLWQFVAMYLLVQNADFSRQHIAVALTVSFVGIVALAAASYHFIEVPMRRWIVSGAKSPKRKIITQEPIPL
jgi:peptidoglycan/LPS O-acetylase OafA/YrhL